jgi:hypothetical protein
MKRLVAAFAALLFSASASFSATAPSYPNTPFGPSAVATSSTSAGAYTLIVGASATTDCNSMYFSNNDSVSHNITLALFPNGGAYPSFTYTLTVNAFSILQFLAPANVPNLPLDKNQTPYMRFNNTDTLKFAFTTAISSGANIGVNGSCAQY